MKEIIDELKHVLNIQYLTIIFQFILIPILVWVVKVEKKIVKLETSLYELRKIIYKHPIDENKHKKEG